MSIAIHEVGTMTTKGQVTVPKAIRQALGLETCRKLVFELHGDEAVMRRADTTHDDPAIDAFLDLLENDLRTGRHLCAVLPPELKEAMLEYRDISVDLEEEIMGEVAL
jgi:antitoxin PrlF